MQKHLKCFVIMPFKKRFDRVYREIEKVVELPDYSVSVRCHRLDSVHQPGKITDKLTRSILESTICIADLTELNPNVMWEVGYAMALRKVVIAVTQDNPSKLPFDLKDLETFRYKPEAALIPTTLAEPLRAALLTALGKADESGRPSTRAYRQIGVNHIIEQACDNAEAIRVPQEKFDGEATYINHLRHELRSLRQGDELLALCGKKNWQSPGVQNYFADNVRAVERGVFVKRIFYIDSAKSDEVMREARRQKASGIEVKIIRPEAAGALQGLHWVPKELGYAIVGGKQVLVHVGAAEVVKSSVYSEPGLVAQFRVLYEQLDAIAEPLPRRRRTTKGRVKKAGASRAKPRKKGAPRR